MSIISLKKNLALTAVFTVAVAFFNLSRASHVPGGNITYECVGPNQYLVTLTLFEDCGTAFETSADEFITVDNDCGLANPGSTSLQNIAFQQEVSQLCPAQIGQSECNGGSLPGIYMHQWQAVITLPGPCDSWTFSYSSCCRNTSTNVSGQPGYYWESVLNDQTGPCNTSPVITAQPIPYVCINQPVNYNLGASEPDGNTLVYSFIGAQSAGGTFVTYNGGYTAGVPIPGITIDPNTGQISFTPTQTGNYIVAILIEEYDANGNLVGSIIHDIQFEVINCSNVNPSPPVGGITNYTGNGGLIAPDAVEVCEGDAFCFDVVFDDPDLTNVLTVTSNVTTVLPGATLTTTGTNPVTATICWTAQPGSPTFNSFVLTVEDDGCPINGIATMPIEVHIINSTYAGANVTMCQGVPTQLNASGGTTFDWTLISGDPIVVGTNFSCNPCQDPIVNPAVTSVYEVTSNLTGGCVNVDTITVTVVPDFTYNLTQSSGNSCLLDPLQVDITPNPSGAYTYNWTSPTGTGGMSCTNCANPTITESSPGNYTYYVDITSPQGCVKQDSVTLNVAAAYAPQITAMASEDTVICGDPVDLDVDLGGGIPAQCGASTSGGCVGAVTPYTIGTNDGENTGTTWPAPFGNWYANAKHQFIYTAAELQAAGFVGGKITEITWETTNQNTAISTFLNYQVSIGCTGLSAFNSTTFETGLTQVFGPQNVNVVLGQNTLTFTTPYEWDGVSNLIVEVCYEWTAQYSYTRNWSTPYTNTGFNSSLYYYSDGTPACPNTTGFVQSPNRPVTTFTTCPSVPDPNNYTFDWTPSAPPNGVVSATAQNTQASPSFPTWYVVTVTDINGGCTDVDSVYVFTDCCDPSTVIGTDPTCFGGTNGEISTSPQGTIDPYEIIITDQGGTTVHNVTGVTAGSTDIATGLGAGTYTVSTIDAALCQHDTTIVIGEPDEIIASTQDTTICLTGTATLTATAIGGDGGPYTFEWVGLGTGTQLVSPMADTCYDVIATDAAGCSSDTVQLCVTLNPALTSTLNAPVTAVCPGTPVDMDASAAGGNGGPYTITWLEDGTQIGTGTNITVDPVNPLTTYCAVVSDGCETPEDTACVDVDVFEVPEVQFTTDVVDGCFPVEVNFTNTTDPSLTGDCFWDFGNGANSTDCDPNYIYENIGTYTVTLTVTSPNGCQSDTTAVDYINVYPYPNAAFDFSPDNGTILNPEITFQNQSTDNVINQWTFGESGIIGTSTEVNPEVEFPNNNPGTYPVELYVENQYGCADTAYSIVIIQGIFTFYVPNSFTPDGDGINDVFLPLGDGVDVEDYELFIFDRWGEVVFTTEDINQGWDGRFKNQLAKQDVYVWKIKARDRFTGELKEFNGHVTLLR